MNRHALLAFLSLVLFSTLAPVAVHAQQATDPLLTSMLDAIQTADMQKFTASAEPEFKARVTQELIARLFTTVGPRLKDGYTARFLGDLKQKDTQVYVYKLAFKNGSDDLLVRLILRDGKVSGFILE